MDPPLRLGRLRLRGELTEIREADLALTLEETGRRCSPAAGVELEPERTPAACGTRTEGWAGASGSPR